MGKNNFLIREKQATDIEALQNLLNDPNITAETKQGIQGLIANAQKFAQQQAPVAPTTQPAPAPQQAPVAPAAQPAPAAQTGLVSQYSGSRTNPYTTQYKGPSIVDFLKQSGQASDKASRAKLAVDLGIVSKPEDYKFTAEQNTQMLNTLKQKATGIDQAIASKNPTPQQQKPQPQGQINPKNYAGGKRGGSVQSFEAEKAQSPAPQQTATQEQPNIMQKVGGALKKSVQNIYGGANQPKQEQEEGEENEEGSKKFQYFGLNKTTVQEKNNISKFLKHLSEKNYSSAHKYLKAIVENKVRRKILNKI